MKKFVVRSERISKIFTDVRKAVDACRSDLETPDNGSMEKMRWIVDGRLEIGDGVMFFNDWQNADDDEQFRYCQLFVCEED